MDHETDLLPEAQIFEVKEEEKLVESTSRNGEIFPESEISSDAKVLHREDPLEICSEQVPELLPETLTAPYLEDTMAIKMEIAEEPSSSMDVPTDEEAETQEKHTFEYDKAPYGEYGSIPNPIPNPIPNYEPNRIPNGSFSGLPNGIPNPQYGRPYAAPNTLYNPYSMENKAPGGAYGTSGYPGNRTTNPYEPGYYQQGSFGAGHVPNGYGAGYGQYPYYQGQNPFHMPCSAPMPVQKKNRKPVISMILSLIAMGFLNYFPFIALIFAVIGVCVAFTGLMEGRIGTGAKVCGCIGLGLGIIAMILSVAMLIMLLSLSVQIMNR